MEHDDKKKNNNKPDDKYEIININEAAFAAIQNTVQQLQIENEKLKAENQKLCRSGSGQFTEYMSGIFENASFGMYRTTPDGRILIANNAIAKMLGYLSVDELLGRNLEKGGYEPGYSRVDFINRIEKNGQLSGLISAWTKRDGSIIYVREDCRTIRDKNGKTLYYDGIVENITAYRKAAIALCQSENKYRTLVETADHAIILTNLKGNHLFRNKAYYINFGYNVGDNMGINELSIVHPNDAAILKNKLTETLRNRKSVCEYRVKHKEGHWIYCHASSVVIYDNNNKPEMILKIIEDITERKRTETTLRVLSLRNEAILAAVPDIIAEIGANKKYAWVNQAGYDFFGDDVIGKETSYYFEGEQKTHNAAQPLFNGYENVIYIESWQRRRDGEKRLLAWWCQVLKDVDGNVTGTLSTARDITEQKKAEEALRLSEKKYRQVVEHATELIFTTDINGNFLFANSVVQHISGYSIKELRQMNYLDLILPEYRRSSQIHFMKQYLKRETTSYLEYPFQTKDNKTLWFAQNTALNVENDKIIGFHAVARDITERKAAEEALREAEERFRTIVETAPCFLAITDKKGKNIYVSPNCEKITGYTQEELKKNQTWMVHENDNEKARKLYECTFREGKCEKDFEYKAVKKNGEIWYASSSWEPLKDNDGKFKGIVFQTIDITKLKRAKEALRETRDYLENLINYANAPIIVWDSELRITRFNHAFEQLTGRNAGEMIESQLGILFPIQQREKSMALIRRTISGERWNEVEIPIMHTDGSVRIVSWSSATLFTSDGSNPIAVIAHGQDITEHKKAEEALKQSEEKYRTLIENIQDGVFVIQNRKLMFANEAFANVSGFSLDEIIGKDFKDFIAPDDLDLLEKAYLQLMSDENIPAEFEFRVIQKNKNAYNHVNMTAGLFNYQGKTAALGTLKDITARKLAEDKVKQSLAEKEILLKEIHHRVKNNLQVISSLLELQSEHVTDNKTLEILKVSQNRIRAMGLIHESLYHSSDLSQINFTGYIENLLENLCNSFGINIEAIKISINVGDIQFSISKAISCGLIINELVTNSLKYAFKDGEEGEIAISLYSDDGHYTMIISDTGACFPENFDFANTETLGLQLVNLLAKQLKGTIELNRENKTEFIISFA
ncbi:MAG: PAS domain S-box protein [candidate division Zixibacteria bacterium]|nr:PAS domain S-box protein [candidate division Zixibacteria bacterium]